MERCRHKLDRSSRHLVEEGHCLVQHTLKRVCSPSEAEKACLQLA